MASYYSQFLTTFIILLAGIQEGLLVPSSASNHNEQINKIFDIGFLLNRLDQLETKVEQHEAMVSLVNQHALKISSQQIEIDQLKKKNSALEEQLHISNKKTSSAERLASRKPSSCLDLLDLGHTLPGFYDVLPAGSSQIASIFCDFGLQPTEADFETRIGFVDVKSGPVHFFVTRLSPWSFGRIIPFEVEYLNLGAGMNLTSGVFTVPKAGTYTFSFKGSSYRADDVDYAGYGEVSIQRNRVSLAKGYSVVFGATSGTWSTIYVQATLKLDEGDTIAIFHEGGEIYSNSDSHTQFMGSLLEEDLAFA